MFGKMYRRRVELALGECTGGERVLEVGFGTGLAFPNLHDIYKEIHGIDLTADIEAVQSVFEPLGIPLFLEKGDVLNMPYPENKFDTVLLISILEHLKPLELEQAFAEVKRVLKPGGQMVYGTPVEKPFMVLKPVFHRGYSPQTDAILDRIEGTQQAAIAKLYPGAPNNTIDVQAEPTNLAGFTEKIENAESLQELAAIGDSLANLPLTVEERKVLADIYRTRKHHLETGEATPEQIAEAQASATEGDLKL